MQQQGNGSISGLLDIVLTLLFTSVTIRLNDTVLLGNHHMEHDGFSDKSEREAHDDWDTAANENSGRLTEESDMDQSDELSPGPQATAYVEQSTEEMAEVRHLTVLYVESSTLFCLSCKSFTVFLPF